MHLRLQHPARAVAAAGSPAPTFSNASALLHLVKHTESSRVCSWNTCWKADSVTLSSASAHLQAEWWGQAE